MSNVMEENANALQGERDLLEQLLKPEVQESLTQLVEQLPKLAEMMTVMTKYYDLIQLLVTDEILKKDTVEAVKEFTAPVAQTVKQVAANVIEAKDRAEESDEVIGIFGLLKLLKQPETQRLLRFVNAYVQVATEKNSSE